MTPSDLCNLNWYLPLFQCPVPFNYLWYNIQITYANITLALGKDNCCKFGGSYLTNVNLRQE